MPPRGRKSGEDFDLRFSFVDLSVLRVGQFCEIDPRPAVSFLEAKPSSALTFFFVPKSFSTNDPRPNAAKLRPSIPLHRSRRNPDPAHARSRPPDPDAEPKPYQAHALRVRHRSLRQRPRTLHRALLHHRDPVRGIRRGNDFPF